jgi:sialate O-acetylesterase
LYKQIKIHGAVAIIDFTHKGSGLISKDGQPIRGFVIAGEDGKFVSAMAIIKNNEIELRASGIQHPVAARFNWNEAAHPNLYNKEGLPAFPFRTDNLLEKEFK